MHHLSQSAKRLGLYIHAAGFVIGMAVVAVVNLLTGPPYWVLWVLLGWSIGLVSHGLCVFLTGPPKSETT